MAYHKIFVDNVKCSRRFHIAFDDENPNLETVKLDCPFCGITVFEAKDHPAVEISRQENLIQTADLADLTMKECNFKDNFSVAPKNK